MFLRISISAKTKKTKNLRTQKLTPHPCMDGWGGSLLLCQLLAFVIEEYEQAVVETYTLVDLDADEIALLG